MKSTAMYWQCIQRLVPANRRQTFLSPRPDHEQDGRDGSGDRIRPHLRADWGGIRREVLEGGSQVEGLRLHRRQVPGPVLHQENHETGLWFASCLLFNLFFVLLFSALNIVFMSRVDSNPVWTRLANMFAKRLGQGRTGGLDGLRVKKQV